MSSLVTISRQLFITVPLPYSFFVRYLFNFYGILKLYHLSNAGRRLEPLDQLLHEIILSLIEFTLTRPELHY